MKKIIMKKRKLPKIELVCSLSLLFPKICFVSSLQFSPEGTELSTVLRVSSVSSADSGMYSCVPNGTHPATVLVHVQTGALCSVLLCQINGNSNQI